MHQNLSYNYLQKRTTNLKPKKLAIHDGKRVFIILKLILIITELVLVVLRRHRRRLVQQLDPHLPQQLDRPYRQQ